MKDNPGSLAATVAQALVRVEGRIQRDPRGRGACYVPIGRSGASLLS